MLLCEQERLLTAEQNLINNPTLYMTNSTSLVTIHDYGNITVPAGGSLVIFSLDTLLAHSGAWANGCAIAIQVGGLMYVAAFYYDNNGPDNKHLCAIVWLLAGTYDVSVVGLVQNGSLTVEAYNMQVGLVQFNDVVAQGLTLLSGSGSVPVYLTVNNRALPTGNLNQAVFAINICTNGTLGSTFTLTIDGVAHTDPDEASNYAGGETINGYYVYKFYIPLSVGVQHTITLGLSGVNVYFSIVACPWILTTPARKHQPITLTFPQNSSLYMALGSLFNDAVKDAYVGATKGITYGASDYYAHGIAETGVLSFTYNFQSVNVTQASFFVDGLGGCIENIGVDVA